MDPKTLSNLDPKLRETYERVMGNTTSGSPTPSAATPPTGPDPFANSAPNAAIPTPAATPVVDPGVATAPVTPAAMPEVAPLVTPVIPQTPVMPAEAAPLPSPASVNQYAQASGSSPLVRILYILGAVIFFIVYTYFWMKVFNLQLPF